MSAYSRRPLAKGASGAGFWVWVMEVFALICVPINIAIIYFAGYVTIEKDAAGKNVFNTENAFSDFLAKRDPEFWTTPMVILLLVFIEHLILALKIVVSTLIPDVTNKVVENESKRPKVIEFARKELLDYQVKTKAKTYDELIHAQEIDSLKNNQGGGVSGSIKVNTFDALAEMRKQIDSSYK
jgi:hypothetical protein